MDENFVMIGTKPESSYVLAIVTQFSKGAKDVVVKARGNSISRAVGVAEAFRNRFDSKAKIEVRIGSEEMKRNAGGVAQVPFIEILISK